MVGARAGHTYPHVGLLDQHRAPSATARGRRAWLFPPPRIPAHVARGAASKEGERGCSSFARAHSFQLSVHPPFCSLSLACIAYPHGCEFPVLKMLWMAGCVQTDKASMLDEIIDYVKFLQLQVKASMNFNNVLVVVLV